MTAGPCVALACSSTNTRRYLNGAACADHSPWATAGRTEPDINIDPTRCENVLRIAVTPTWAKGGTDIAKERPGGYKSRQRVIKEAAQRDATSTLQHPERNTA